MSKSAIIKIFTIGAACISAAFLGHSAYKGYTLAVTPSKFEHTAKLLKFNGNERISAKVQQEALLKAFYYAGYFKPENLWQDINHLGFDNPEDVFLSIMKAVVKSGANQKDQSKFNPTILRKHLFNTDSISESDALDLLMYIGQHAFNRELNQERNELSEQTWMEQYKSEYTKVATDLGLVERISPSNVMYDEAVVLGAARYTVTGRILDYIHNTNNGIVIKGITTALAGKRPLWAEIDGISSDVYEQLIGKSREGKRIEDINLQHGTLREVTSGGVDYMLALASKIGIEINNDEQTIIYRTEDDIPSGFRSGRTYLNYIDTKKFLTETDMVYDVLDTISKGKIKVSDTESSPDGSRPDTSSTARDYANSFIERIQSGHFGGQKEFIIYVQSNQPYVKRQTLAVQNEIDRAIEESGIEGLKIIAEGVGYGVGEISIKRSHSELGALLSVEYQNALRENNHIHTERHLRDLQFSTRDKSETSEQIPDFSEITLDSKIPILGAVEDWFFQHYDVDEL